MKRKTCFLIKHRHTTESQQYKAVKAYFDQQLLQQGKGNLSTEWDSVPNREQRVRFVAKEQSGLEVVDELKITLRLG